MNNEKLILPQYQNRLSKKNKIARMLWSITWTLFARPLPRGIGDFWKIFLLRLFGAKVHSTAVINSSARIYQPWNLEMDEYSCLAPEVDCYNVGKISIGAYATVSQKSYLCAASHNISSAEHELIYKSIVIKSQAWVGADAFIGMGVVIGEGAVVGARSCVFKNVEPWSIVGGNPAKFLKTRKIQ